MLSSLLRQRWPAAEAITARRAGQASGGAGETDRWHEELFHYAIENLNRLEEFAPGAMLPQVVDRLNQWAPYQEPLDDWQPDPLLATLPPPLAKLGVLRNLDQLQYTLSDAEALQQAFWIRDVDGWACGFPAGRSGPRPAAVRLDGPQRATGTTTGRRRQAAGPFAAAPLGNAVDRPGGPSIGPGCSCSWRSRRASMPLCSACPTRHTSTWRSPGRSAFASARGVCLRSHAGPSHSRSRRHQAPGRRALGNPAGNAVATGGPRHAAAQAGCRREDTVSGAKIAVGPGGGPGRGAPHQPVETDEAGAIATGGPAKGGGGGGPFAAGGALEKPAHIHDVRLWLFPFDTWQSLEHLPEIKRRLRAVPLLPFETVVPIHAGRVERRGEIRNGQRPLERPPAASARPVQRRIDRHVFLPGHASLERRTRRRPAANGRALLQIGPGRRSAVLYRGAQGGGPAAGRTGRPCCSWPPSTTPATGWA